CAEPRVYLSVLLEMLAPHVAAGRVKLLTGYFPRFTDTAGDEVTQVEAWHNDAPPVSLQAPYFVDATETGELLALGRAEHVTGAEARRDTKEPHAPPEANPRNHQAFTLCFAVDYQEGKDNTLEKPAGYAKWREYVPMLEPKWPGNLLSWEMSDPVSLKP